MNEEDKISEYYIVIKFYVIPKIIRYSETEESCSMSLALDENNAKAYLLRAKARAKLGKLELAIQGITVILLTVKGYNI